MIKKIFIVCATLFPNIVMAGACNPFYCEGKITNLYTNGTTGKVSVKMDGDMSQLNCTLSDGYMSLKQDSAYFSEIYSTLLAASVAKVNIRVRTEEGSPDCKVLYTMIKD